MVVIARLLLASASLALFQLAGAEPLTAPSAPLGWLDSIPAPSDFSGEFDCIDAFNLFAALATARCEFNPEPYDPWTKLDAARARLIAAGYFERADFADVRISWCPLLSGTGMVPDVRHLYLDDGLRGSSVDGVAEVLAHELVHIRQFRALGDREFKCAYVRGLAACGSCQDRAHPLEREAYELQDRVRNGFLKQLGIEPPAAPPSPPHRP